MQTLATFLLIILAIYLYLIYYHNINTNNILDVMHTAFIRQLVFELIPFIILFGTREMYLVNVASAPLFFNSVIGRSMIGMIAFTFVSYVITAATPQKPSAITVNTENPEINDDDKDDDKDNHDELDKEESQYLSNNDTIEKFGNMRRYKRKKPTANDTQLLRYALI
jgi:hypothetical protein